MFYTLTVTAAAVLKSIGYDHNNDFENRFALKGNQPVFPLEIGKA